MAQKHTRDPAKRLYVANLSYDMSKEDVEELLSEFGGVVDVYLPTDVDAARHRGYGFVEMDTHEEAMGAITGLHEEEDFFGRTLTVRLADPSRKKNTNTW